LSGWFRSRSIGNRSCAVVRHLPVRLGEKVRPDRNKAHFFATASQSGSVADRRIHHAASTLYHTWKGSVLFAVVMAVIALLATVLHAFEAGAWVEGLIAKRPDSVYEPGRRSGAWVKIKLTRAQEFVIGGYTPPEGSRKYFAALLVGYYGPEGLLFAGRVGTGLSEKALETLYDGFQKSGVIGQCLRGSTVPLPAAPIAAPVKDWRRDRLLKD
jgi:hypothetical protein